MLPGWGVGWGDGGVGFHHLGDSSMPAVMGSCEMMQDGGLLSHDDKIRNHSLSKGSLPILRLWVVTLGMWQIIIGSQCLGLHRCHCH